MHTTEGSLFLQENGTLFGMIKAYVAGWSWNFQLSKETIPILLRVEPASNG